MDDAPPASLPDPAEEPALHVEPDSREPEGSGGVPEVESQELDSQELSDRPGAAANRGSFVGEAAGSGVRMPPGLSEEVSTNTMFVKIENSNGKAGYHVRTVPVEVDMALDFYRELVAEALGQYSQAYGGEEHRGIRKAIADGGLESTEYIPDAEDCWLVGQERCMHYVRLEVLLVVANASVAEAREHQARLRSSFEPGESEVVPDAEENRDSDSSGVARTSDFRQVRYVDTVAGSAAAQRTLPDRIRDRRLRCSAEGV